MGEEFSTLTQKGTIQLGGTVAIMVGVGPGSQLEGAEGRDRHPRDFPLLVVNYRETSSPASPTGLTDVKTNLRSMESLSIEK